MIDTSFLDDTGITLETIFNSNPNVVADVLCFSQENYEAFSKRFSKEYDISEPNAEDFYIVSVKKKN